MKILKILLLVILCIALMIGLYIHFEGKLGKGSFYLTDTGYDAIISTEDHTIYLSDTLEIKYDDDYILAQRVPEKIFQCENNLEVLFEKEIQYLIINKNTNEIFGTDNYEDFNHKRKVLNIQFSFSENDNVRAKNKLRRNSRFYKNKNKVELDSSCKEIQKTKIIKITGLYNQKPLKKSRHNKTVESVDVD